MRDTIAKMILKRRPVYTNSKLFSPLQRQQSRFTTKTTDGSKVIPNVEASTRQVKPLFQDTSCPVTFPKADYEKPATNLNSIEPKTIRDSELSLALKKTIEEISKAEKLLLKDFEERDMNILQKQFIEIHSVVRKYFQFTPFWTLFWKSDNFTSTLKNQLQRAPLLMAEYQVYIINKMVYSMGKALGMISNLASNTKSNFASIEKGNSKFTLDSKLFLDSLPDADRLISSTAIDQFALRNQIAVFDDSAHFTDLSSRIYELVRSQFIGQGLILTSCIFAAHFGVPIAITIPGGVLAFALGLTWMNSKYTGIQQDFTAGLSQIHKTLSHNLKGVHQLQIQRLTDPLKSRCKEIEEFLK
jgi:hypothetical protein